MWAYCNGSIIIMKKLLLLVAFILLVSAQSVHANKFKYQDVVKSSSDYIILYWKMKLFYMGWESIDLLKIAEGHCNRYKKNVYSFDSRKIKNLKNQHFYACAANESQAQNIFYNYAGQSSNIVDKKVKYKLSQDDTREAKFARLISFCERELGFKKGSTENGNCALKIYQTETALEQSGAQQNSSGALAKQMNLNNSLRIMQQGLKMMNPPQPKLNCTTTHLGWTCY